MNGWWYSLSTEINLYVLDRTNLTVKGTSQSYSWEINRDYLTNEKSKFVPARNVECAQGDLLLVKTTQEQIVQSGYSKTIKPLYIGVVHSFDNNTIETCDFYSVLNFDFPATRKYGNGSDNNSAEYHLTMLILRYFFWDTSKMYGNIEIDIPSGIGTAYSYIPKDPPISTNLNRYLIHFFKKYNIVYDIDSIYYSEQDTNQLCVKTSVKQKSNKIQLKNNVYDFVNWSVYEEPAGAKGENMLIIFDKNTIDSENPIKLSTWYMQEDGNLTQSYSNNVRLPTRQKIYIYDTTQENAPTYQEIASSELSYSGYAHEINFDIRKNNNILSVDELEIGLLADIIHNEKKYSSVLTGFVVNSNSSFMSLKFGNIRSTLQDVIDDL